MTVTASQHAAQRWFQRADYPASRRVGLLTAWHDGHELPETPGLDCDEARYYPPAGVVLVVCDEVIATVIDIDRARNTTLRTVADRLGGEQA